MKFKFLYSEWQEDEGFEIEMVPGIGCLDETDLSQPQYFEAFMKGYFDHRLFISAQLSELKNIEYLEKQLMNTEETEVVFM